MDVGSAQPEYDRWLPFTHHKIIGFEPNEEEFNKIKSSENTLFYKIAVGSHSGKIPLYITGWWSNTSTLRPNIALIRRLAYQDEHWELVKTLEVPCATLDMILNEGGMRSHPDFIKLDTQGSELAIIQAAPKTLESAFGVEVEVQFLPIYEEQALFEDVQCVMRGKGFQLMDLGNKLHVKGRNSTGMGGNKSNFISADALYFRSLDYIEEHMASWTPTRLESWVGVCLAYGYDDYAFELCHICKKRNHIPEHAEKIQSILLKPKALSCRQRIKRSRLAQYIGHKLYRLAKKIVVEDQYKESAHWFYGIGNRG